jgi:hypothetical protein
MLVAKYHGDLVDGEQAVRRVGFRPQTGNASHDPCNVKSTHVLMVL